MLQTSPKWAKWPRGQKENRGAVLEVIPPPIWVLPAESLDIMEQEKKKKTLLCLSKFLTLRNHEQNEIV